MNYWLSPFAFFVGGMTLKWVLDLFFLRRACQETEFNLNVREAEFTALKHEHSQKLTELKNKLMELDATAKAKAVVEGTLAKQNSDLASLRAHLLRTEEDLLTSRNKEVTLTEKLTSRDNELQVAAIRIHSLEGESRDHASTAESYRLRLEEASLQATTQRAVVVELRSALAAVQQELDAANGRSVALGGELDAQRSVIATLEAAVHSRDVQITDSQSRYAALEAERQSVATFLGVADRELAFARSELDELSRQLKESQQASSAHELELASRQRQLDAITRDRDAALELIQQRESAVEVAERQVAELRRLAEESAVERQRMLMELESQSTSAPLPSEPPAPPAPALIDRLRDVEAELEAVSTSHAHLETELIRERKWTADLQEKLREVKETVVQPPVSTPAPSTAAVPREAALLAEIDELNRERNTLAAELAALKSAQPPTPTPARRKKGRPPEVDLFGVTPEASVEASTTKAPADGPDSGEAVREFSAQCPQHLSDVKGIGPAFETRLYAAGVGSYWELAQLSDRTLAEALELDELHREQFDFAATRADASRLAEETGSVGRKWTGEQPDDLEPLEGIGPTIEKRLYDAGICTFKALAATTEEHLAELCPPAKFRGANYAHWIEQARQRIASEEN